ncbi:MAG: ATP-binding protein [Nitrospirota bacterium]
MILYPLTLFITSFINLFLGIFVFTKNVKSEKNKTFAFLEFSIAIWGFGMLIMTLSQDKQMAMLAITILHLGLFFSFSSFFNFVLSIINDRSKINKSICLLGYISSLLFTFIDKIPFMAIVKDVRLIFGSYQPVAGPLAPVFNLTFLSFMSYGGYLLYKRYKHTESFLEKNRIKYIFIGMTIVVLSSITNILLVMGIKVYPIGHIGLTIYALMVAYAIIKYRLMDITVIIHKGLVYSLLTALVTAVWLSAIFTFEVFLHFQTLSARIFAIMIIILIFQPVREKIQLIVDKLFYRERHDLQQLLKKATKKLATIIEKETLLSSILTIIMEAIHPKYAVLMLLDESLGGYKPEFGIGNYNSSLVIRQDEPIIRWFNQEKRELLHEEVMENPEFNGMRDDVARAVERMASMLSIPLISKDKLVGILNLGPKLNEKPYTHDEITFLTTLSDETAVALENTGLYTALKKHTLELEKKTQQLQISNDAKSNFLKIVSHELRTPLTVILGYIGLLSIKALEGEAQERGIKIMEEKCRHLNELIGDILDLSKIERGEVYEFKKQPVDLKRIIEEVILIFSPEAQKKGIILQQEVSPNLPLIMYDLELAKDIFTKLVDNAIKFIKVGQASSLSTDKVGRTGFQPVNFMEANDRVEACPTINNTANNITNKVTIRLEDKGSYLEGCVEDTGIGIKKENFEKIFERFYQLDMSDIREYEGTGLGLSIVKEIIEQSGGSIKVESEPGKGSKFIFTLPKEEVKGELPQIGLKGKSPQETKILIVEAQEDILGLAELYLKFHGYEIHTAQNGVQALEKLYAEKPDLVIYGLRVPKVDGYEIGHILRDHEETKDVPLLMLVPVDEEENLDKIYKAGATTHLFKPFDFKELMEKVTNLV